MRLIDADALINDARDRYCKDCDKRKGIKRGKWKIIYEIGDVPCRACDVDDMVNDIESAPTVSPDMAQVLAYECGKAERKRGEWIDGHCSECGCDVPAYIIDWKWQKDMDAKFCPMCGAEMRTKETDRDYERSVEQLEHDMLYEPTYNPDDGSM